MEIAMFVVAVVASIVAFMSTIVNFITICTMSVFVKEFYIEVDDIKKDLKAVVSVLKSK